jgi:hexosaminidase
MKNFLLLFAFLLATFSIADAQSADPDLGIIPAPASVKITGGKFTLGSNDHMAIVYGSPSDERIARLFHDFMKQHYALDLPVRSRRDQHAEKIISFSSVKGTNKESYTLTITPDRVNVSGKDAGLFYGLQSLMQLFPLKVKSTLTIPCAEIIDSPRYQYRGMMLGVSYHLFPVKFIKELIDLMATYKLNTLHWHLTDDHGWRIEIKKYPLLTKTGAWRKETQIGHNRNEFDGKRYGGYYTQDQIRDIVRYAQERYITIIPEIEMPGHCSAALASYPWLGCSGGPYHVATAWGIYKDIYCPTDSTFQFLEDVLTEVMALFPSHYIHIGGDEVPKDSWKNSAFCQQLMKENGLKNEEQLQSYFIKRIERFVNSKGREIIGWDEILEGGLAPHAVVESWRGTKGGIAAAKQDHDVIMAPTDYVYFDYLQGKADQEPIAIGGYNPLEDVYSYNPTPASLTPQQQEHILGVEACVWTEYISTPAKAAYMILPRMMALSEIAWTPLDRKSYNDFSAIRLPEHLAKLDTSAVLYRVPETIGIKNDTLYGGSFTFTLKPSVNGAKIYYTLDGYNPDRTTFIYKKPLTVLVPKGQQRILKTLVITPSGKSSNITTTILNNPYK